MKEQKLLFIKLIVLYIQVTEGGAVHHGMRPASKTEEEEIPEVRLSSTSSFSSSCFISHECVSSRQESFRNMGDSVNEYTTRLQQQVRDVACKCKKYQCFTIIYYVFVLPYCCIEVACYCCRCLGLC